MKILNFFRLSIVAILAVGTAEAKSSREAWHVTRTSDPITDASTCVLSAYDQIGAFNYSRVGYLYPIVENSSKYGLLVGVSSGGQIRLPVGDILWRVDDRPFRELKSSDNPATALVVPLAAYKTGNVAADKAIADSMVSTARMIAGITSTTTAASGDKAKEMLAEMLSGQNLIFRQATVAPAYGLPSENAYRVGQITNKGLKPIPLDDSFRAGLAACGISSAATATPELEQKLNI